MKLSETDKAYIAGLFDGEGSVGWYEKSRTLTVLVCNTNFKALKWLQDHISYGTVNIKYENRNDWQNMWEWKIHSRQHVREFLSLIRPYLIIKADQVDLLLSFLDAEEKIPRKRGTKRPNNLAEMSSKLELDLKQLKRGISHSIH